MTVMEKIALFRTLLVLNIAFFGSGVGALVVLVLGNVVSIGTFGIVVYAVNGYFTGALMRTVECTASDVSPWLWSFVFPEVFAFARAGAVATMMVVGKESIPIAIRAIGGSAGILCATAILEAVLIRWAWGY